MNNETATIMKANDNDIRVMRVDGEDYISLTDLARYKNPFNPADVIKKWLVTMIQLNF